MVQFAFKAYVVLLGKRIIVNSRKQQECSTRIR